MDKLDLAKQFKPLYTAKAVPALIDIPSLPFLAIDGEGDPNGAEFMVASEALYSLAYTLKFASKNSGGHDWTVMKLEGLWWADDPVAFQTRDLSKWQWRLLILQPDCVTQADVDVAKAALAAKKDLPELERVRLEHFSEGRCAQLLHIGPYAAEGPNIAQLHAFIHSQGLALQGKHHEIYLSDPRRTAPEKLKTILRQPVA